ncbi:hypothetical protein [Bergeriella denitrificans]|uniref:Uncharacterized protein n=1 Tax=Bergeriella denitrificans TaxID=494 RepID=A0A378UJ21_BERDE|nr:hypothetical protein [Bergeriella denitrificans]STZ77368.1 Uncharacterised protein [Bergeriella denitrificans]
MLDEILHVYGQQQYHDDLIICGTRPALEKLKSAIEAALTHSDGFEMGTGFQNDGEGYDIEVYLVTEAEAMTLNHAYHNTEMFPDSIGFDGWDGYDTKPYSPKSAN